MTAPIFLNAAMRNADRADLGLLGDTILALNASDKDAAE